MNPNTWAPLWLSFEIAFLATLLSGLLGIPLAAWLARGRFWGRDAIDVLVTAPMVLPPTVLGYYVLVLLGRQSIVGQAFESLTGSSIVFTRTGACIAATLSSFPLVLKSARASIEDIDPWLIAAAQTLGAGKIRLFFTILFPLSKRGIAAGLALGFARSLGDFGLTLMVAGNIPGETQTASLAIYDAVMANHEQKALGMILVLSSLAMLALYGVNKLTQRRGHGF